MARKEIKYARISVCVAGALCALPAFAQSSVTIWGTLDSGVQYVSNMDGHHTVMTAAGIELPSMLGIRGNEDLGGGTSAVFELVSQFDNDDGDLMSNGGLFARNAYVGLTNPRWGTLKLGNQYDFMTDSLFFSGDDPADMSGHLYSFRAGPFQKLNLPDNPTGSFDWDRMSGETVSNSVKYVTPTFHGFRAGVMYNFGNVAGSVGAGNGASVGLDYAAKNFSVDAAYTNLKYMTGVGSSQTSVRNWGIGAHYDWQNLRVAAILTTVRNSENNAGVWEGSVGVHYHFTPAVSAGADYTYMKGNAEVDNNHAHQLAANVMYNFSKRTDVYLMGIYQRSNSGSNAQIAGLNGSDNASSGNSQAIIRVGVHLMF